MAKWRNAAAAALVACGLVLLVVTGVTYMFVKDRFNQVQPVFAMNDPRGDDHGPGSYKYPIDSIFDPKKELFDLTRFSFSTQRNNYYFDMNFPRVTNPWGASEGFSHTMIQVYVADSSETGRVEPLKEGANVLFSPKYPWKYLLKVVSFNKSAVYWDTDYEGAEGRSKGVVAQLQEDGKTIRVSVPKTFLPGDPYSWRFYVLVGSQEGDGPDNYRPVRTVVSQWSFGGGTETSYSPNVIDMLAPPKRQEQMLGAYSVSDKRQAFIDPVGPSAVTPSAWERYLDKAAPVFQAAKVRL